MFVRLECTVFSNASIPNVQVFWEQHGLGIPDDDRDFQQTSETSSTKIHRVALTSFLSIPTGQKEASCQLVKDLDRTFSCMGVEKKDPEDGNPKKVESGRIPIECESHSTINMINLTIA